MRFPGRLGCLLTVCVVLACGGEPNTAGFTLTDSAGVRIAVSAESVWNTDPSASWHLSGEPVLDLTRSGTGPEHEFYRVEDATRYADGRVVVANTGSSEIRVFSLSGVALGVAGREGDGPGEYRQIMSVDRIAGDSLLVYSWPTRVTILDPDLVLARTFELRDYTSGVHPLGSGILLAALMFPSLAEYEGTGGVIRAPTPLARMTTTGELIDTVAIAAGFEELMAELGESRFSAGILFGKRLALGVSEGVIVTGPGELMEFTVLTADGRPSLIVRVPNFPLSISNAEMEAERAALLGPEPTRSGRELLRLMPMRTERPAYTNLLVDSDGNYWAGAYQGRTAYGKKPRGWEVFDPGGRWLGSLTTPVGFTVFEIGSDYVLGVLADSLDVEHVQILGLVK